MADAIAEQTGQLLLDLGTLPSLERDDLIVARTNLSAVSLVDAWPQWPSPFAMLVGPPGSGKTHLATIWRHKSGARDCDPAALGPADLDAAQHGTPILIDGLQPRGLDEAMVFHLINAVRSAGSFMLITASLSPLTWNIATPDLVSRFRAMTTVEIGEPDDSLLAAVITKLFADRQITVEPNVIDYLVTRIERSLETALSVVDRLDRASLARKTRITRHLAGEILRDFDQGQGRLDL